MKVVIFALLVGVALAGDYYPKRGGHSYGYWPYGYGYNNQHNYYNPGQAAVNHRALHFFERHGDFRNGYYFPNNYYGYGNHHGYGDHSYGHAYNYNGVYGHGHHDDDHDHHYDHHDHHDDHYAHDHHDHYDDHHHDHHDYKDNSYAVAPVKAQVHKVVYKAPAKNVY